MLSQVMIIVSVAMYSIMSFLSQSHDNGKCRHVFNYVMLSQVMILVSVDMYSVMSCYHKS